MASSGSYQLELQHLSTIGAWQITDRLGQGGFGTLLKAHKQSIDGKLEYAAIKVLNKPVTTPSELANFIREYQILREVRSDYVARVLDSGRSVASPSA